MLATACDTLCRQKVNSFWNVRNATASSASVKLCLDGSPSYSGTASVTVPEGSAFVDRPIETHDESYVTQSSCSRPDEVNNHPKISLSTESAATYALCDDEEGARYVIIGKDDPCPEDFQEIAAPGPC